jgi:hypothetical protein
VTSCIKRRLAVLALALGLIAAAPNIFDFVADQRPSMRVGKWIELRASANEHGRSAELWVYLFRAIYDSQPPYSRFVWMNYVNPASSFDMGLPDEYITLRVACFVALTGVWLLVVGGRLLARRWTREAAG